MSLEIIGMYGPITGGTENAIAQIDIPMDGVIRGIDWDLHANLDADNENVAIEFSFIATAQLTQNDVRGRISSISSIIAVLDATGPQAIGLQKWIGGMELVVSGGERVYIHAGSTAGVTGAVRLNLHFDSGGVVTRRSARR